MPGVFVFVLTTLNPTCQHTVSGHYWPTSETQFKWRFASGPIVAHFKMLSEQSPCFNYRLVKKIYFLMLFIFIFDTLMRHYRQMWILLWDLSLWSYYYGDLGFVTHSGVIVKLHSNKGWQKWELSNMFASRLHPVVDIYILCCHAKTEIKSDFKGFFLHLFFKNVNYGLIIIIRCCHWLDIHDDKTVISYFMPRH